MAFFGLTHLGAQYPIGDKMIVNPRRESQDGANDTQTGQPALGQKSLGSPEFSEQSEVHTQPLPYSTNIHHGSHKKYKEMVKRNQTPRAPNQLYVMPLTDSQQYGWLVSENPEPWTQVQRFPRKNSLSKKCQ